VISVRTDAGEINGKDGIREQIEILGQLSKTLDEYFIMRNNGQDGWNGR
jgi:hypothetical protein